MLTRWLLIGLLISVVALLVVVGAVVRHVLRQHRTRVDEAASGETGLDTERPVGSDAESDAGLSPSGLMAGDNEAKRDASEKLGRTDVTGER